MKPKPIHFVGLDVHQSVVACVRGESGNVVMRATVPTEQKAILALVRNASWPRVHVAFEEGTQARWLHDALVDQVERVVGGITTFVIDRSARHRATPESRRDRPRFCGAAWPGIA